MDIQLDENGDISIPTRPCTGEDLIIQKVRIRSETFFGEWILDSRKGVPWLAWLDETPPPLEQIEDFLKVEYEEIDGVRRADVTATESEDLLTIHVDARIYLDQGDSPTYQLTATLAADEPTVFRVIRLAGIL